MASFTTRELIEDIVTRLEGAVYQTDIADTVFNMVKAPTVFDVNSGMRYAQQSPCALVIFDGQTPRENNPELVETNVSIVVLTKGAPEVGGDAWDQGSLIGAKGLLDIITSVRQALAYNDGDDDDFQIWWRQTTSTAVLARRDGPGGVIACELRCTCLHQDVET